MNTTACAGQRHPVDTSASCQVCALALGTLASASDTCRGSRVSITTQ
jgi:hypothetical protein